ncbi:hypothetical protein SASPL_139130 [Salvia splendens]|uniref:Gag1-like clamp domain-containing protein n=1 Tax=Salvia splendens TaxID=180675 RepID=A0A8X8ZFP6_SALSN|nr:hypothetical protein SASPL_139130 [Salvia splendens]
MADPQKKKNVKEKDPMQDLDIGDDFFSWKSISMGEGDGLDFDLTPVSKGNKETFKFDKDMYLGVHGHFLEQSIDLVDILNLSYTDMDFNLDADFGKMTSFDLDMSDLDISPQEKRESKSKERPQESSSGKNKEKTDRFTFGIDFDDGFDDFGFDSVPRKEGTKVQSDKNNKESSPDFGFDSIPRKEGTKVLSDKNNKERSPDFGFDSIPRKEGTKVQSDKNNKEHSPDGSGCQDKEISTYKNETGSKSTSKGGVQKPSFDLVLGPARKICPPKLGMDDGVTQEHLAGADEVKGPLETTISREIPDVSPSERLVLLEQADLQACTENDVTLDLSSAPLSKNEPSGCNSSALEKKVDSVDASKSGSHGVQDTNTALVAVSTFDYKHATSRNSQHHQADAISENIAETSVHDSSVAESKLSCMDTNASSLNGEQDANITSVVGSTCDYKHTSKASQHDQAVVFSDNINVERTLAGSQNLVEDGGGRAELGHTNPQVEIPCTTGALSGMPCDSDAQSSKENQEFSCKMLKPSLTSQPANQLQKPIQNIKEPLMKFPQPSVQLKKPECSIPKASIQATLSSFTSNHMSSALPSLVQARSGDTTQSEKKLSLQCSKTLLRGIIPQIQSQKSCSPLKINGMETNHNPAESSENPKLLASILSNKNTPVQVDRTSAIEGGRKLPDTPALKLSRLSIDSTKPPILTKSRPVESSSQKSVSVSKSPLGTANLWDKCKPMTSTLSVKRTLEDDTADTSALHPAKRLSPQVPRSRSFVETSEKVLDKKSPINRMKDDRIKSTTSNCQVVPLVISHEFKTKGLEITSSTRDDSNIKLANAYSKELDELCDLLNKKSDEAKELLARSVLNSNKLMMLNVPLLEEKISFACIDFVFVIHRSSIINDFGETESALTFQRLRTHERGLISSFAVIFVRKQVLEIFGVVILLCWLSILGHTPEQITISNKGRLLVPVPLFLELNVMFLSHGQRGNVVFSFIVLPNTVVGTRTFCCLHTFYVILELNCFLYYVCYVISLMKRLKQKEPFFSLWSQVVVLGTTLNEQLPYFPELTEGECLFVQGMMEINGKASHKNEKKPLENSAPASVPKRLPENNSSTSIFVNHAAIAWDESRRKWIGNAPQKSEDRSMKDPIISWTTTYEDLLLTHEPFSEPIPLPEMVDFLVDIWHDEGLFD